MGKYNESPLSAGKGSRRRPGTGYEKGWELIFGDRLKEEERGKQNKPVHRQPR